MPKKASRAVEAVLEKVRANVRNGTYLVGQFLPPEMELAAEVGVSRGTVRTAIDRLLETHELSRLPHSRPLIASGSAPAKPVGSEVQVWISQPMARSETLALVKGLSEGFVGSDVQMVVREPIRYSEDFVKSGEIRFLIELISNQSVAGAILQRDPFADDEALVKQVMALGKPLVFVDCQPLPGTVSDFVGTENVSAARRCVEHLIEIGHRRIVCALDSEEPSSLRQRREGYWRAMRGAGIESAGRCIVADELPITEDANHIVWYDELSERIVKEILAMQPMPTAIFAGCDQLAQGLRAALYRQGLSVPADLSIVGFDWLGRWDPAFETLTTANQNFEGFGRHAANLMLDRLAGQAPAVSRQVLLEAPLVIGTSTAPPRP